MARILVHPHLQYGPPLQTKALTSPSHHLLRQAFLLPRGRRQALPMPPYCQRPAHPHTQLWCRPLTPNYAALRGMNGFWHRVQRWTTNKFFSTPTSILSREACLPSIVSNCSYKRRLCALRIICAPPYANQASARLPQSFPSLSAFRAQGASSHLIIGLSSVYLPLSWCTRVPSPPIRKHLPVDTLAHLTLPLQKGLRYLPLFLHAPPPAGTNIHPTELMRRTCEALWARGTNMLLQDWATHDPTPPYYEYPPSLSLHPFMGLGKFLAGRIHQMTSVKSYLAAHPSRFNESQTQPSQDAESDQSPSSTPSSPALPAHGFETSC